MQNTEQESHSWLKLSILLFCLIIYGVLNVVSGDGDINMNLNDSKVINLLKVLQAVSVIIIFILPSVLFSVFWTKSRIHYLGITKKAAFSTLLIAGIGMLLAMPMINWLAELNQHMKLPDAWNGMEMWMKHSEEKAGQLTEAFTKGTTVGVLITNLFVIAFMAAVSEEIFFRGILQKVLVECTRNKHIGVWIGAALFSAFHMQFFGFFPRMLMGAYLGYLFLWSGSLWPGMIAHFFNNGMAVYLSWLMNRGEISADADKIGIEQDQWIYVCTSIVLVSISMFLVYKIEKKRNTIRLNPDQI